MKEDIDPETLLKLNILFNSSLNGLTLDEINLSIISKMNGLPLALAKATTKLFIFRVVDIIPTKALKTIIFTITLSMVRTSL